MRINPLESLFFDNAWENNEISENDKYGDEISFFNRKNSDRDYFYGYQNQFEKEAVKLDFGVDSEVIKKNKDHDSDSCIHLVTDDDIEASNEEPTATFEPVTEESPIKEDTTVLTQTVDETQEVKVTSKKGSRKTKTTEFAYLLERKAFRMMRKYYKEQFEFTVECPEYKKNLPVMTADEINALVCKFMQQEFNFLATLLTEKDYVRTRDALKTIILCDRYKKKERVSEGLNFAPLRNVLHKYNTRNLIEFLSDAANSFLFTHFFLKNGQKAIEEQDDVSREKLVHRMRHLMKEASNYLPAEINSVFEEIYNSIHH